MSQYYSESDLLQLIKGRFAAPEYAVLFKVTDGTGSNYSRICDALAMNLWPSRGNAVHGFEVKVSRGDWLRELKHPEKADAIACYCEYWWIVAPKGIVHDGELPETWGLLCPHGRGLKVQVKAPKTPSQPLDKLFIGAMLRRAVEDMVPKSQIAGELQTEYQRGRADAERHAEQHASSEARGNKMQLEALRKSVEQFELASGVKIDHYNGGRVGDAVRCVMTGRHERESLVRLMHDAKRHAYSAQQIADAIAQTLAENPAQ
jgi:hypothetical protein